MAQLDDTIATYLTAIEVEGKTQNTVLSYRASLEDFRRVGHRLGFPSELEAYSVEHVYRFLGDLKQRGASPACTRRDKLDRLGGRAELRTVPVGGAGHCGSPFSAHGTAR